jgi:hypothetical protein
MTRALLVLALVAAAAQPARAGKQVTYAIVIGNNAPPRAGTPEVLAPLHYADDDAVRYFQLFSRFAEAHLLAVLDDETQRRYPGMAAYAEPPTLANLSRTVADLAARMQADRARGDRPVLYFAFSGHGARDDHGQPFLALQDGALTQRLLYEGVLGKLPTVFTHVIVDACHAGGVVGVRGGGFFDHETSAPTVPATASDVQPILEATPLARYPNVGVIIATTLGQESHEWSEIESGVFTHELLSALAGAADVNGDLVIEYSEVQAFVAAANRDIRDPRAVPHIIARAPQVNQNAALVSLPELAGMRFVRGDASAFGHFHIELANGQRYLDAHLAPGTPVTLAVPDGAAYLRTDTDEATLPEHGAVALASIAMKTRSTASRGAIEASYQTALFASGYGRAYYQGYVDSIGEIGVRFPEPVTDSPRTRTTRRRHLAEGTAVLGGVAALTALTTGALAYEAHADYTSTSLQRPAHDAQVRYDRYLPISITSGAVAVAAGIATWWLWPRSPVRITPSSNSVALSFDW